MAYRPIYPLLAVLGAVALTGCQDFMVAIGKEKVVPDEFAVVSRAPLAIPPDYSLRPPRAGAARPQEQAPVDQARQTVFRAGDQQASLPAAEAARSAGETSLLQEAGAGTAPPNIRELITNDAEDAGNLSDSFVDKLVFWRKSDKAGAVNDVINPREEADRLRDAQNGAAAYKAPGANPSLAGTPIIERSQPESSWFSHIF
jgi:hypothetical protein